MAKLNLNSISPSVFEYRENGANSTRTARDEVVSEGRALFYEHARKGRDAIYLASKRAVDNSPRMNDKAYKQANEIFQKDLLLFCAKKACDEDDMDAPETLEAFKKNGGFYQRNQKFMRTLQGIVQQIVTPILPAVYSEAVSVFADVVEVGFGETYAISVESDEIPIFQDSAWGASRSVPATRFYSRSLTLNPQPKTAEIRMKWHQLVGNGTDFGAYFANIAAGMYAKTMGMWSAAMVAASQDPTLIPSGLTGTFSSLNWVNIVNKLSAVNNTAPTNILGFGNMVALAKVLPTNATGSANADMDAALAMMLGADYIRNAQLGEFMKVRLMPLMDAVVPGTQNSNITTVLPDDKVWLMAANRRKPLTICYNSYTPITVELEPKETNGAFEYILNLTIALDSAAVFASKIANLTV